MNCTDEIHYTLDAEGNFTYLNDAGERILGYSCAEAQRMNVAQLVAPDVSAQLREQINKISKEPLGGVYEIDIITKDGQCITLEISNSVICREGFPSEIHGFAVPLAGRPELINSNRQRCLHPEFFVGPLI